MVTPSQAQGGHQIDCMLPLTPSHPGVHSGNFSLSSSSPTITQTCNFQTFPFLVDVFPLPPHTQHKCFLGLAPCRQTALPSPSPVQRTFKQKKKNSFTTFLLTNFIQRLQEFLVHFKALLAGPWLNLLPCSAQALLEGWLSFLALLFPASGYNILPFSIWELPYLLVRFFPTPAAADIFQSFS